LVDVDVDVDGAAVADPLRGPGWTGQQGTGNREPGYVVPGPWSLVPSPAAAGPGRRRRDLHLRPCVPTTTSNATLPCRSSTDTPRFMLAGLMPGLARFRTLV